jgi:hypothetical protein
MRQYRQKNLLKYVRTFEQSIAETSQNVNFLRLKCVKTVDIVYTIYIC